jgi:hypothetical protein
VLVARTGLLVDHATTLLLKAFDHSGWDLALILGIFRPRYLVLKQWNSGPTVGASETGCQDQST